MDRLHVQGVAEHEGDGVVLAEVGQPIPGEHALGADNQAVTERPDRIQESGGRGGQVSLEDCLTAVVEHVGEQAPGVQIDPGVKSVLSGVASHGLVRLLGDGPT